MPSSTSFSSERGGGERGERREGRTIEKFKFFFKKKKKNSNFLPNFLFFFPHRWSSPRLSRSKVRDDLLVVGVDRRQPRGVVLFHPFHELLGDVVVGELVRVEAVNKKIK
jgi:hypothetical protein